MPKPRRIDQYQELADLLLANPHIGYVERKLGKNTIIRLSRHIPQLQDNTLQEQTAKPC
jgi:hypothetical protein